MSKISDKAVQNVFFDIQNKSNSLDKMEPRVNTLNNPIRTCDVMRIVMLNAKCLVRQYVVEYSKPLLVIVCGMYGCRFTGCNQTH